MNKLTGSYKTAPVKKVKKRRKAKPSVDTNEVLLSVFFLLCKNCVHYSMKRCFRKEGFCDQYFETKKKIAAQQKETKRIENKAW